MAEQSLLSDLCKICTSNPPKYTCPRCLTPTCSLACSKRHKLWAQCSGVRDPAAFIPSSKLATPAGIDRDFNYLSGIERAFQRADRNVQARGISLQPNDSNGKEPQTGSNLSRYLNTNHVIVKRMPRGMSRQKANRTHWHTKQKCIQWTVEWIHPDGSRDTAQCRDNLSLDVAYAELLAQLRKPKKRKAVADAEERLQSVGEDAEVQKGIKVRAANDVDGFTMAGASEITSPLSTSTTSPIIMSTPLSAPFPRVSTSGEGIAIIHVSPPASPVPSVISPRPVPHSSSSRHSAAQSRPEPYHFYLHRPLVSSKVPILLPLTSTITLSRALRERTVIEYPTIYVLHEAPDSVSPDKFTIQEAPPRKIEVVEVQKTNDLRTGQDQVHDGDEVEYVPTADLALPGTDEGEGVGTGGLRPRSLEVNGEDDQDDESEYEPPDMSEHWNKLPDVQAGLMADEGRSDSGAGTIDQRCTGAEDVLEMLRRDIQIAGNQL